MRAELTEEQTLLRETVARLLADTYPFEARRALLHSPDGWSRDLWSAMAELGLLSLAVPEEAGGLNAGGIELAIVAEALGAALSAEPVLPTAVSAVRMLAATGRMDTLEALTSGQSIVSVGTETWLEVAADGHLTAELVSVPWANTAERLLLFVQGPDGTALIAVDTDRPEITRRAHRTFDGLAAADVNIQALNMGTTDVLADGDAARQLHREARTLRELWLAAEAVGLMQVALDATVEHLKSRVQFGKPLGEFQALQHRCAEMLIALEQARSAAILAASVLDDPSAERDRAAASLVITESARIVGQAAVQLHGGIGVTDEHKVGWIFRRLTMIGLLLGDADEQARRLAQLGGIVDLD